MRIVEKRFRGSVICRVLGYPISYGITKLLSEKGRMDLDSLAEAVKRSKPAVCYQLTKLRMVNIVRYEKKSHATQYWVKYPREVKKLLDTCEALARRASRRLDRDY